MPQRLEILQTIIDLCNAESIKVVYDGPRIMTLEIIINRNLMANCAKEYMTTWEGDVRSIEKINKGDVAYTETGDGLYRYTLVIEK